MFLPMFVYLSVCLLARYWKTRAWIWMKCCVSTDVGLNFEPDPDYSPDTETRLLSLISYKHWYAEFFVGKIPHTRIGNVVFGASRGFKWFYSPRRQITFVWGTCALQSALLVSDQIFYSLMQNNTLHHAQHGYIRRRSTCTKLIETLNDWTVVLQYKGSVTVTYTDFSKALDSVSHNKLFIKLASYGICSIVYLYVLKPS